MNNKPSRWSKSAASQYLDPVVAADYGARDPYDVEVTRVLNSLAVGHRCLDVGCGTGDLSYLLSSVMSEVDAIDPSAPMLDIAAQRWPGISWINWIQGTVEDTQLQGDYGLVTAADSIHWTDWPRFFPCLKPLMRSSCRLVIIERGRTILWKEQEKKVISRFFTETDNGVYHPQDEIAKRGYWIQQGRHTTTPVTRTVSIKEYLQEKHSRNGLTRSRLGDLNVARFDAEMNDILRPYVVDGQLSFDTYCHLWWGPVLPKKI